ncbi:MAG: hypothetical protein P9L99_07680 [Candidatus Lernaella stagnicola]|nr:hypothetical protein [Candidatus Lernaella stagnicola]
MSKKAIAVIFVLILAAVCIYSLNKNDPIDPYGFKFPLGTKNVDEVKNMGDAVKMLKKEEQELIAKFLSRKKSLSEFEKVGIDPTCSISEAIADQIKVDRRGGLLDLGL